MIFIASKSGWGKGNKVVNSFHRTKVKIFNRAMYFNPVNIRLKIYVE